MKAWFIAIVIFLVLLAFYFHENDNEKIIYIDYAVEFTNKLGRTIENPELVYNLPLHSNVKNKNDKLELRIGNESEVFIVSRLATMSPHETLISNINLSLSVTKPTNIPGNFISEYLYENSAVDNLEVLSDAFESSSSPSEFIHNNPNPEAITFLASTLSKQNHKVRVVSGVKLLDKVQQSPECWLQIFENNQWNDISIDKTERLPFKIMLPQTEITERSCQASLVEVWGLDVTDLKVTLKL